MHPKIAQLAKRGLLATGHYQRKLAGDRFPGVAVLCYHGLRRDDAEAGSMAFEALHVRAAEFDAHCRLIRETCDPIRLNDWIAENARLPPRPVLVTFDDGYGTVFSLAKPILEEYGIPAVIFVTSRPAMERRRFWFDRVAIHLGESAVEDLKRCSYEEWRRRVNEVPEDSLADDDPHAPLTLEELRVLARHPLFEIGGHTMIHPILARALAEVQRNEIFGNRNELETRIGVKIWAFAYPNGRPRLDYSEETLQLVQEAGFEMAFSSRSGFALPSESRWERSRFLMLSGISEAELAHRLAYSWRRPVD